jgi:hypothetical protein
MHDMMKRHEVQVLRRTGHTQAEVTRLTGVSEREVRRIEDEPAVTDPLRGAARRVLAARLRPRGRALHRRVPPAERIAEDRARLRALKVAPQDLALRIPVFVGPTGYNAVRAPLAGREAGRRAAARRRAGARSLSPACRRGRGRPPKPVTTSAVSRFAGADAVFVFTSACHVASCARRSASSTNRRCAAEAPPLGRHAHATRPVRPAVHPRRVRKQRPIRATLTVGCESRAAVQPDDPLLRQVRH